MMAFYSFVHQSPSSLTNKPPEIVRLALLDYTRFARQGRRPNWSEKVILDAAWRPCYHAALIATTTQTILHSICVRMCCHWPM
jgi:hypothetical protein